jgi:WD40 repeat protein/predicted Ser/Thr protein kinase
MCPVCLIDFSAGPVRSFGDFELLDEIARGGMGIVYRARQRSLDRVVALKLILSGQFASEQAKERFLIEARAAANLRHPGIVAVHEVGEQDGFQFYSMDYIPGQSLAEAVREKPMPPDKAAQSVRQVAEAIEYAHQHGVLHRDLKPSNVLLDASGHPHVTDFGLAKTNNTDAGLTVSGQMLGSPHYLPPEQAGGNTNGGGPWSDVYSLGAILYHLLTGRAPFLGQSVQDTLTQVLQKDPVAPRLLVPRVPRDLETICLKCLQKEPQRRYQSAQELADELDRFLARRPICARPVNRAEKLWRWCRRQPAVASLAGTAALLLAAGSLLVFSQWRQTEHQRRRAEASLEANRQLLYLGDMRSAFTSLAENELAPLRAALRNQIPAGSQTDLRGFEWRYLWARAYPEVAARLPERKGVAGASGFSPDGAILAVYYWDDSLRWWDVRTGRELRPAFSNASALGAFSQHGDEYVFGTRDGTINVCRLGTGELTQKMKGVGELVAITPDGTMAVTIKDEEYLSVVDLASGKSTFSKAAKIRRRSDISWAAAVAIADDGKTLALSLPYQGAKPSLYAQTSVELYDLETKKPLPPVRHIAEVASLIFAKNGKTLITGWSDGSILLSDTSGGNSRRLGGHKLSVQALALSQDGHTLASGSSDEMIQLWDLPSGTLKPPMAPGPLGDIWSLTFSPDGQRLAAGGRNTVVTVWDLLNTPVPENIEELSPEKTWGNFAFSPNSKLMAAVCKGGVLKVWQTESLRVVATLDNISYVMAFSPDASALLAANSREEPLWWKLDDNKVVPLPERGMSGVLCADVSANRRLGILGHNNGTLQLVDIEAGKDLAQWPAHEGGVLSVRFSDSSGKIISGGRDRSVAVWDALSQKRIGWNPGEHRGAVCGLAYSTVAGRIASGCGADMIKIWDPADLSKALASMPSHKGAITSLDFSGDGKTLASGSEDMTVRLFNVSSAQEIATLAMDSPVRLVVFAPDGNSLAIVTDSGRLRLLRAATFDRAETLTRALRP